MSRQHQRFGGQNRHQVIRTGLPLLPLRSAEPERSVTRRSARTPEAPDRDRREHAATPLDQVDRVAEQIAAIRSDLSTGSAAILTALGPHLDDPAIARQSCHGELRDDLLVSDEGRVVFRVEDDLAGLRNNCRLRGAGHSKGQSPLSRPGCSN